MDGVLKLRTSRGIVENQQISNVKDLVLILLKERSGMEISPTLVPGFGVYYSIAGFHIPADNIIKHYMEAFLEVKGYVSFPSCSICRSTSLKLEVLCPNCRWNDLLRIDLVVHYECGFMAGVEDFIKDDQGVIEKCPKCGKTLKRVGIDYGRPGLGFRCQRCGTIFQYPLTTLRCDKDHVTTLDKLNLERYPVFTVSSDLQKVQPVIDLIQKIERELEHSLGVRAEALKIIKGKSGTVHLAHVLIYFNNKVAAIEVLSEGVNIMEAMSTVSKAVDLGIHFIVILDEKGAAEYRKVLNPAYFTLVPMRGGRFEDFKDVLLESVYSIVKEKNI
ncbi:MAG: hypothetical protein QXQ48_06395 [Nitrososphaerota archaeon]